MSEIKHARELNRRDFLVLLSGLGVSVASGCWVWASFLEVDGETTENGNNHGDPDVPFWAMVIDLEACIGCDRCAYACQATNDTADDHLWNIVIHDQNTFEKPVFVPRPCMHCEHAPCIEVCPVSATYHRPDGLVEMDYSRCIGCRYCMVACPYGSRVFNWEDNTADNPQTPDWGETEVERRPRGVVEKCTFCSHRLDAASERGLRPGYDPAATPACCVICPTEARRFGDLHDLNSPASRAMEGRQAIVLRSELGTHPRVFYLLPTS